MGGPRGPEGVVEAGAGPGAAAAGAGAAAAGSLFAASPFAVSLPFAAAEPPSAGLASEAGAESPSPDLATFLSPRKSVTYQPEPLSWNPAAVTCLTNVAAPHAGQTFSGGSEIFRSTSCAWPQFVQR